MENKKERLFTVLGFLVRLLVGIAGTVGLAVGGGILAEQLSPTVRSALEWAAPVAAGLLILMLAASILLTRRFSGQKKALSAAQVQEEFAARKEKAAEDLTLAGRRLRRARRNLCLWQGLTVLLSVVAIIAGGMNTARSMWCVIVGMILLIGALCRLSRPMGRPVAPGYLLPRAEHEALYALCEKARDTLGAEGKVRLAVEHNGSASVARFRKETYLMFGTVLLSVLDEEELYQVLLHEFAHVSGDLPDTRKAQALADRIRRAGNRFTGLMGFFHGVFSLVNSYQTLVFDYEFFFYSIASSVVVEKKADGAVQTWGNPQAFARALTKICFYDYFEQEWNAKEGENFFAGESYPADFEFRVIRQYRQSLQERQAFWRAMAEKEIQPRNASHPILRERLAALGITCYDPTLPDDAGTPYRQACDSAIRFYQELRVREESEVYAKLREEYYIAPRQTVEAWKEAGSPLDAPDIRRVMNAMRQIGRSGEAEALADALLAEETPGMPVVHAHYIKGLSLLERYDPAGIGYLYCAAETNFNYAEECLETIGTFCCKNGLEKELEEYRERAVALHEKGQQRAWDRAPSRRDVYLPEHLPAGVLESILSYVKEIDDGTVDKLYLVRRQINESFGYSTFIIQYKETCDPDKADAFYDKLFEHLDMRTENIDFYLMNASDMTRSVVSRVENAQVYPEKGSSSGEEKDTEEI